MPWADEGIALVNITIHSKPRYQSSPSSSTAASHAVEKVKDSFLVLLTERGLNEVTFSINTTNGPRRERDDNPHEAQLR